MADAANHRRSETYEGNMILLEGLRQKNADFILQVFDDYSGLIYSITLDVLKDSCMAEEVMQEVLLALWYAPDSYDPGLGPLRNWLVVMSRYRAISRLHRSNQSTRDDDLFSISREKCSRAERCPIPTDARPTNIGMRLRRVSGGLEE